MDDDTGARTADHTRRSALRVGAAVAWTVPVMTVLGTSPAHADVASGPPPREGKVPPPPPVDTPRRPAPAVRAGSPELADTGSEAAPLAIAGLGLVAGGAAVLAAARRSDANAADGES